jgi:nitrite reductase/ring-hydroxylating ferredoxin subunit/uncharacterized membrane protein
MRTWPVIERLGHRLDAAECLDRPADALAAALHHVLRPGPVEDALTGTTLGHPLHPVLIGFPIGSWAAATVLDAVRADCDARRMLVGLGIITAVPTALSGAGDWLSTVGPTRRLGLVHAAGGIGALALETASWLARRRGRHATGTMLSLAATAPLGAGIWLGEHLVFGRGVGVDTTVFQELPGDWRDVAAEADVPGDAALCVEVDGVPVLLNRLQGEVVALADRCTHRGAPLHEGRVAGGCVTCPWHGSRFDLRTGYVVSGPASRPQPRLEVRSVDGRVRVRRDRARNMASRPVMRAGRNWTGRQVPGRAHGGT